MSLKVKAISQEHGYEAAVKDIREAHAIKDASILKRSVIFSVVSIVLAGIAIYVLYAGNVGPHPLWNLSSHALGFKASVIAGIGGGAAAIGMIFAICRRALNTYEAQSIIDAFASRNILPSIEPDDNHVFFREPEGENFEDSFE